jgi:hypothetical protein
MLRDMVPTRYRRKLAATRRTLRQPTASLRHLPSFIIIGAQRAGTSSLFRYLCQHPEVRRPLRKEIDYFSASYSEPLSWYRAHFPLRLSRGVTFEATPQYAVHPLAAERCHAALPDAKLVFSVRDPLARAISSHRHMSKLGFEPLDFRSALVAERERIEEDLRLIHVDPGHNPKMLFRYGYATRSRYAEQLDRWVEQFGETSIHVFSFDDFVIDPTSEFDALLAFLGLEPWRPADFRNWTGTPYLAQVDDNTRATFDELVADDIQRFLFEAKRTFPWANSHSSRAGAV